MAWQLHYTSARSGPTGRAGFQFVAETPDLPPGMRAAVTPFMAYRPPPRAPLSPGAAELTGFPVALGYDRVAGWPLLVRCRYLGQDYSGRQGNFFGHAVVAEAGELEGLRPVELWGAPHWAARPGQGELPALDDLVPGTAFDPEALAEWLTESPAAPYDLLAGLIDAIAGVLGRGHGRVVLVADDAELIARWIAVVSYSLPVPAAALMSFLTYSADPDTVPQRIVGTTPDVWETTRHDGPVFFVDAADGRQVPHPAGRYARTAADCWRGADFTSLDAMSELADSVLRTGSDAWPLNVVLDRAAALLVLCRGEETVTADEEAGAAALLTRGGAEPPEWAWRDLAPALPGMGFDLAIAIMSWARRRDPDLAERCAARCVVLALDDPGLRPRLPDLDLPEPALTRLTPVIVDTLRAAPDLTEIARITGLAERLGTRLPRPEVAAAAAGCARHGAADLVTALDAVPAGLRETLLTGALTGLEAADAPTRAAVLTDAACDLVHESTGSGLPPAVARRVLGSVGRRRRDRRLDVTRSLLELDTAGSTGSRREIDAALREVWAQPPTAAECGLVLDSLGAAPPRYAALQELPTRVFLRLAESGADLEAPESVALATRVHDVLPTECHADAAVVQAYAGAVQAAEPAAAARRLDEIMLEADQASGVLLEAVFGCAAQRLTLRTPVFRAALLAAAREQARDQLIARWTGVRQSRGARHELVEVALRLRGLGVGHPPLEEWAGGQVAGRIAYARLDSHLRDQHDLRAGLKELAARGRRQRRGG